ncbi:X-box-binding protein 1 [Grifola frondosa]|uniref:X-box-binding protein 1 n=1 Tax=Grifola frondosa TaxID=5627 RepID=A0A1C7M1P4_GRIFR|nr:X-box-binding protein 1 [Grifola frondosa]
MKRSAEMDLSNPSTPSDASPSPPSTSTDLQPEPEGPPRKRSRSEVTAEERREARAHRNRIAAQNSRDRRKAQFTYLERRVAELEEENRQLRAGMGLAELRRSEEQRSDEREKDRAREKENEELRDRIKTLETGWNAVVQALAASGLPLAIPSPSSSTLSPSSNPSASSPSPSQPPTTTFPVLVSPAPIFPISPAPTDISSDSSTPLFDFDDFEPTRHLARVATTDALRLSSLEIDPSSYPPLPTNTDSASSPAVDEVAMEVLLREILAPSPTLPQATLPADSSSAITLPAPRSRSQSQSQPTSGAPAPLTALPLMDWQGEAEMQRLLDMLPGVQTDADTSADTDLDIGDFASTLELELYGWDMGAPSNLSSVGVF